METIKIIARIRSDFPQKFGIPRQSGVVPELRSELIFTPDDSIDQGSRIIGILGDIEKEPPVGPSSDPAAHLPEAEDEV